MAFGLVAAQADNATLYDSGVLKTIYSVSKPLACLAGAHIIELWSLKRCRPRCDHGTAVLYAKCTPTATTSSVERERGRGCRVEMGRNVHGGGPRVPAGASMIALCCCDSQFRRRGADDAFFPHRMTCSFSVVWGGNSQSFCVGRRGQTKPWRIGIRTGFVRLH